MDFPDHIPQVSQTAAMEATSRDSTPSAVSDDSIPKVTNDDETTPVQIIRFIRASIISDCVLLRVLLILLLLS